MRHLKQHADGLLDSILNHPNLTEPQIYQMDAAQKEELRRRVQIADDVSLVYSIFCMQLFVCSTYCLKHHLQVSVLSYKNCPAWRMTRYACCLTRPILHVCNALHTCASRGISLQRSAVCCMQVIDSVINKLWDKDYDGAKIYQDYEKGLQELLSVITASSPGEHFQLPQQDRSQLAQVSFNFAFYLHP